MELFSKILRVHVLLEDGKDFSEQLLLMQIEKLQSGVHSVNNGVLVYESRQLMHDGVDQILRVVEVVHDVAARNHLMLSVHAVVESSNIIDMVDLVCGNSTVVDSSDLFGDSNSFFTSFFTLFSGLYESKGTK